MFHICVSPCARLAIHTGGGVVGSLLPRSDSSTAAQLQQASARRRKVVASRQHGIGVCSGVGAVWSGSGVRWGRVGWGGRVGRGGVG